MPSDPYGLAIARERIAEEKEKRTGFLNLGQLGLEELPEELFELEHLCGLNLGATWTDEQHEVHGAASDLAPNKHADQLIVHLQRFPGLRLLSVSRTDISDLGPLAGMGALQSLYCVGTQVSNLAPLERLSTLQSLDCLDSQVSDLGPLAGLTSLQSLHCSYTKVSDLGPLAGLTGLQKLDCSETQVSDLGPLAGLTSLQSLRCGGTQVSDLGPLAGLTSLQSLHCGGTQVSDLGPLAGLTSLQSLTFFFTRVSDLRPLADLSSLRSLNCSDTRVSDLKPLERLSALQSLHCSWTKVSDLPKPLVWLESLGELILFKTRITDIPAEVLSPDDRTSCLESLRAHLRDLEVPKERMSDVRPDLLRPTHPKIAGRGHVVGPEPEDAAPERAMEFTMPPSDKISYCVSYAWNDESTVIVDRLCREAEHREIKILRDTNGLGIGESITKFMKKLGARDRVFVILSDKYLKSPYCMSELLEVWRNCKEELEVLRQRIRVYHLPSAKMMTPLERLECAAYWDDELQKLDEVVRKRGPGLLAGADLERYKRMREFVHHVGDMLALIADTLLPRDFDQLVKYGFGDGTVSSPPS
jgi:Leucine-rich repeat (LRR) protein